MEPLSVLSLTLVYCDQTVGWIRMLLSTEVGLGPGHIVLDGDPASPRKGHNSPQLFGPCLLWPKGRPSQQLLSVVAQLMAESLYLTMYVKTRLTRDLQFNRFKSLLFTPPQNLHLLTCLFNYSSWILSYVVSSQLPSLRVTRSTGSGRVGVLDP